MANLNLIINSCVKGCKINYSFDSKDGYFCVLQNELNEEVSSIMKCSNHMSFDVDEDGIYHFYVVNCPGATLTDEGIAIGSTTYSPLQFIKYSQSPFVESAEKSTFCACKLQKCLVNLQMKVFQEMQKNCGKRCPKLDDLKSQRDFLFIAMWLIEHLNSEEKMERLMDVYKGIQSCGSLCSNLLKETNNCGCDE